MISTALISTALVLVGLLGAAELHAQTSPTPSAAAPSQPAASAKAAPTAQTPPGAKPAPSAPAAPGAQAPAKAAPSAPAAPSAAAAQPAPAPTTPAATPPPAPTPEQRAEADAALARGEAAYQAGDYAGAVAHFEQSMALAPSAKAQYWLAMSLDLGGNVPRAIEAFRALFANPEHTTLPAEQLDPARQRLSVLEQIPASIALTVQPADVQLLVDGVPQPGVSPFSIKLAPGKHKLRLQRDGYEPMETEITVAAAEALEDDIQLVPVQAAPAPVAATPPPTQAAPREPRSKVPAYVTLGVAGAGAIVGTIFGIQALSAKSTFDDEPTAAHADDVERNALLADMAFGVAFTLGITGVVLLTSDEPADPAPAASLRLAPYASKHGGGASANLTF